ATSAALAGWDATHLEPAPRMADFARWVQASGAVPGFLGVYADNRGGAAATEIEASPFAQAVVEFVGTTGGKWEGTATQLLAGLSRPEDDGRGRHWPTNPKAASDRLARHAPALRSNG